MLSSMIINSDPGIICFQHCISKVFCFNLPIKCPTCNYQLIEKDLKLLPFRLPYPFIKAAQYPCSIVLRPTNGDFLNDYNNSMDLHIAVTNSRGVIVEFDQNGLRKTIGTTIKIIGRRTNDIDNDGIDSNDDSDEKNFNWLQSLLVKSFTEPWYDLWDSVLDEICKQTNWTVDHYKEDTYNCYTFVLKFLQALNYDQELTEASKNKMKFCELYIVPKTIAAGKYISLYRRIRDHGLYTHLIKNTKQQDYSSSGNNSCGSSSSSGSYNNSYFDITCVIDSTTEEDEKLLCQQEKSKNYIISSGNIRTNNSCSCNSNSNGCTKLCTIKE